MQSQPKPNETRSGRIRRARQAKRPEDAFRGGEEQQPLRLPLTSPWHVGTGRLMKPRDEPSA